MLLSVGNSAVSALSLSRAASVVKSPPPTTSGSVSLALSPSSASAPAIGSVSVSVSLASPSSSVLPTSVSGVLEASCKNRHGTTPGAEVDALQRFDCCFTKARKK